jgi:small-conductance mechanosensitive channel
VSKTRGGDRSWTFLILVVAMVAWPSGARAQPVPPAGPAGTPANAVAAVEEAEIAEPAPVLLGGEPVIWIASNAGPYTAQVRAERITERLEGIVHDATIRNPQVTVIDSEASSELRVQHRVLMVVTARDAQVMGVGRSALAAETARVVEAAIRAERLRYAPETLIRSGMYGLIATVALALSLWFIVFLTRWLQRPIARWRTRLLDSTRLQQTEIVSTERLTKGIDRSIGFVRVVLMLLIFDLYLTYVLGLFPWTRAVSMQLLGYVGAPIRAVADAFIGYLPKALFVVVIAFVIHAANRLAAAFFTQIQDGRITFSNFPADWAEPTSKITRVLLIAFGVVVAFPYLPASDSPAFAGVSVFMGVLISLASSSALSNAIAGLVLMYTGAFRLGERVKVGDCFGDIVEMSLLATRVRTIKNEDVTIPNAIVLTSAVTNYTRQATTRGLILHTSVTIGYDAPWRTIHDLLFDAASATPGIVPEPKPFVWQTALNDFYVTYEINAYTQTPHDMAEIYAALHANIQDVFFKAGVEIMSPHYTSVRDGNTIAMPEVFRAPGYEAPGIRVNAIAPSIKSGDQSTGDAGRALRPLVAGKAGLIP